MILRCFLLIIGTFLTSWAPNFINYKSVKCWVFLKRFELVVFWLEYFSGRDDKLNYLKAAIHRSQKYKVKILFEVALHQSIYIYISLNVINYKD